MYTEYVVNTKSEQDKREVYKLIKELFTSIVAECGYTYNSELFNWTKPVINNWGVKLGINPGQLRKELTEISLSNFIYIKPAYLITDEYYSTNMPIDMLPTEYIKARSAAKREFNKYDELVEKLAEAFQARTGRVQKVIHCSNAEVKY